MSALALPPVDALLGLEKAKRMFSKLAEPNCQVQSVLFYGAVGSRKSLVAQNLAMSWLCTNPTSAGSCLECESCRLFQRKVHPDFLEIEPVPPSRLIRLASISVSDEASEKPSIQSFFATAPIRGRSKVVWMRDADRMNEAAANAFLKTLEEPPLNCRIILSTSKPGGMLPTIISRCLCIACELPATKLLVDQFGSLTAEEILLSEGAPGRIEHIREHPEVFEKIAKFGEELLEKSAKDALVVTERFRQISKDFEKTISDYGSEGSVAGKSREAAQVALENLAIFLSDKRPAWIGSILEAHRRIQGNGSIILVTDALFANLLAN